MNINLGPEQTNQHVHLLTELKDVRFFDSAVYQPWLVSGYSLRKTQQKEQYDSEVLFYIVEIRKVLCKQQFVKQKKHNHFDTSNQLKHLVEFYYKGNNLYLKQFNYVSQTNLTKLLFMINFSKIFDMKVKYNGFDFFQLLRLICIDFPQKIFIQLATILNASHNTYNRQEVQEKDLFEQQYLGVHFFKVLFICLLYNQFIKDIQETNSIKQMANLVLKQKNTLYPPSAILYSVFLQFSETGKQTVSQKVMVYQPHFMEEIQDAPVLNYHQVLQKLYENKEHEIFMKKNILLMEQESKNIEEVINILTN